jgi:hypothetical protein
VTQPVPRSPLWWLKRLHSGLQVQQKHFALMDAYYRGEPPRQPWLPEQAQNDLKRLIALTRSNYMGLVIDSMVERMQVEGFRLNGQAMGDKQTWAIWQFNQMDSNSDQLLLESAIGGSSYALIAPNLDRPERPFIYAEHPTQAIVAYEPGTGRRVRAAGLKVWADDWDGTLFATLYLPDALYKWQADKPKPEVVGAGYKVTWIPRQGEDFRQPNPLGVVSLIEVPNNPRMLTGGVSEIEDVISIQDRVNKTLADRMMTQDYGAFPQKWATGFPGEDENGDPQRINVGKDRMVTSDAAETKFGQWEAAALDPYSTAKREDVKDIASRTRTPAQYLLGEMSNVNGETLKASESGLVSKVRDRFKTAGEAIEDIVRLSRAAAGIAGEDEGLETIWRNPEFRTEGELTDSLVKMASIGVPHEALWERWGASPQEIERWKLQRQDQVELDPVAAIARLNQQGADQGGVINGDPGVGN